MLDEKMENYILPKVVTERKVIMKKVLSIILVLSIIIFFPIPTFASELERKSLGQIFTEETPDGIIEAAKDEIVSYIFEGNEDNEDVLAHNYTLGSPINLIEDGGTNHIYHFPVMKDGEIFATFTVYDDKGDYNFQFAEDMMASQLQMMREEGILHDVKLYSDDDGFYAIVNDSVIPLAPYCKTKDMKDIKVKGMERFKAKSPDGNTVNVLEPILHISADMYIPAGNVVRATKEITAKTLTSVKSVPQTDDGTFSGTQKNWCGPAVTAAIINYKKGTSLTAKDVAVEAHGYARNRGLTNTQVVTVGKNHGLSPKSGNPLSFSSVKAQINASQPVYVKMRRTQEDGTKAYHAIAIIGYSSSNYIVINPWHEKSFKIPKKNKGADVVYTVGTRNYKWVKSVYNWK